MKENLLILGAGQYGVVAKETAEAMNCFDSISFLDDKSNDAIGKLADYTRFALAETYAFVAMGNSAIREAWLARLSEAGIKLAVLVHPQAVVMPSAKIEGGSIVEAMAVVNSAAKLAKGSLICAGAVINHNSIVHSCCQIDCNAVVAAGAVVPEGTKVPAGTVFEKQ